jgi:Aldo/keto reductase family
LLEAQSPTSWLIACYQKNTLPQLQTSINFPNQLPLQIFKFTMAQLPASVAKSLEETKVEYKLLGKSGLRVSVPIVGCMSIGNPEWADWVIGPEKALPLLKAAYDRGINTVSDRLEFMFFWRVLVLMRFAWIEQWDSANVYSNGDSERVIAQAIKEYSIPRHKLVIMTKAWSCVGEDQFHAYPILSQLRTSKDYVNQFGLFITPL